MDEPELRQLKTDRVQLLLKLYRGRECEKTRPEYFTRLSANSCQGRSTTGSGRIKVVV